MVEAYGNEKGVLGGVKLEDVKTGEIKDIKVSDALFLNPNTSRASQSTKYSFLSV